LAAIENPRITRAETKDQLNIDLSLDYISKRLNEWGLYSRIARIKEALGVGHRAYRLQFAQEFANFDQWDRTVFVDEATFQTGYAVRTIIWRPMGTAFQNQYIVPKAQSERRSISVFGIMSSRGLGPLIRIGGRFDGGNYINILNDTVLPYIEEEFNLEEFFYYQDNSPVHRSRIARQWFDDHFFRVNLLGHQQNLLT
jgi:hypothetical protein